MTPPSGNSRLEPYATSLAQIETAIAKRQVKADAVLNLLLARDEVQQEIGGGCHRWLRLGWCGVGRIEISADEGRLSQGEASPKPLYGHDYAGGNGCQRQSGSQGGAIAKSPTEMLKLQHKAKLES
jgi:hypothetical protein